MNRIIKRLFNEDVNIQESNEEQVLKNIRTIEGLYFSESSFMHEIYETIEKEELFGENSSGIKTYQQKEWIKILFDSIEYSTSSSIEVIDYKKILNDDLVITLEKNYRVSATHTIELDEGIDSDALVLHYEEKLNLLNI